MIEKAGDFARFFIALLLVVLLAWTYWTIQRRRSHAPTIVEDELAGTAYRVFTREFDRKISGRDLPSLLDGMTSDRLRGWSSVDDGPWNAQVAIAQRILAASVPSAGAASHLEDLLHRHRQGWALTLLVDMSGSMRGDPISHVAAHTWWLCNMLHEAGVPVALLGFSTLGWQGGEASNAWRAAGRPERPGRICALLHMTFKSFDVRMEEPDWRAMLHPDALRENVDGEALEWAVDSLRERPERKKLLIIMSDGAPVDDATLMHNGPSYLQRHLLENIDATLQEGAIFLGGIGIGFAVDRYYPTSFAIDELDNISAATVDLIDQLLSIDQRSPKDLH